MKTAAFHENCHFSHENCRFSHENHTKDHQLPEMVTPMFDCFAKQEFSTFSPMFDFGKNSSLIITEQKLGLHMHVRIDNS